MDARELLRRAIAEFPPDVVNAAGLTVAVAQEYLDQNEPGTSEILTVTAPGVDNRSSR
ncbi:hypothetical protein [Actinoplanes derwentensis]|nr:hypothetical protein [Actinoplanes derwentensis]GID83738.1 hypothetical protein Ade03nite_26620 [Actinoplanes derwentensis]